MHTGGLSLLAWPSYALLLVSAQALAAPSYPLKSALASTN